MKRLILFTVSIFAFTITTWGQNHSSHIADQNIQGPCYIFATVAALEGLSSNDIDISEWHMYSECVAGGLTGNSSELINGTLDQASLVGALKQNDFYDPFGTSTGSGILSGNSGVGCIYSSNNGPNSNTPCMFFCNDNNSMYDYCENNNSGPIGMLRSGDPALNDCSLVSISGDEYFFFSQAPSEYYEFDNITKTDLNQNNLIQELNNYLNAGTGVVLIQNDYRPAGSSDPIAQHAIYIYNKIGSQYQYKDSWPGDASASRIQAIDFTKSVSAFVLNGTLNLIGDEVSCDCEIINPGNIQGPGATIIETTGDCSDLSFNSSSANIDVGIRNGKIKVTLKPGYCDDIAFFYLDGCESIYEEINIDPLPSTPLYISFLADKFCPGETIEVYVSDTNAPYPVTTYDWKITGASGLSGQDGPVNFITLPSIGGGTVTITVNAVNACGQSTELIQTIQVEESCKGGGNQSTGGPNRLIGQLGNGLNIAPNPVSDILEIKNSSTQYISSTIYSMKGELLISTIEKSIHVNMLPEGLYLINLKNSETGEVHSFKFFKQ